MKKNTAKNASKTPKRVKETKNEASTAKKLDSVLDTSPLPETNDHQRSFASKNRARFSWWSLIAVLLIIIFAGLLVYEFSPDFKKSVNGLFATGASSQTMTQQMASDDTQVYEIPLTIVYNSKNTEQKQVLDRYITNLETNLENTKATVTWLDKDEVQAKEYLEKTERLYLPLFITTEKIKEHPRYNDFSAAVQEKNGVLFLQSEGMEYLQIPTIGEARHGGNSAPEQAKVVIIEYGSLTCHYCKEMAPIISEVVKTTTAPVSIVYKHYDRGGPDSTLAQAVECAGEQNVFEPMLNLMYSRQDDLIAGLGNGSDQNKVVADFINKAAEDLKKDYANLNIATLKQCVDSKKYETKIANDTKEAQEFGINGTPAFFVNKQFIGGAVPLEKIKAIVDSEIAAQP